MKVLFLVQDEQLVLLDSLYESVASHCECDLRRLSSADQADLERYFAREVDVSLYDRILLFLRFKKELKQIDFIRRIPNLVTLEHDACQNYTDGKYKGRFSYYYRNIPWIRVICSGFSLSDRLREEGVDAVFVPKGFDQHLLSDLHEPRDIRLGFIGSVNSAVYSERKALLNELEREEGLQILRTSPGEEYRNCLNRIRFFVNSDAGFNEYMIKNFEAMACGCVLLTFDQGELENKALGFLDMHNVVLYRNIDELRAKLGLLSENPALADEIACNGRKLVEQRYTFDVLGRQIVEAMRAPLREQHQNKRSLLSIVRLQWDMRIRKRYKDMARLAFTR